MRILVALDQGTTSSRAIVFDEAGHTLASHAIEFKQHYPRPGWVEHDPDDILGTQVEALQKAVKMSKVDVRDIAAIGITNQRETTLLWEKDTGRCVHNAIVLRHGGQLPGLASGGGKAARDRRDQRRPHDAL